MFDVFIVKYIQILHTLNDFNKIIKIYILFIFICCFYLIAFFLIIFFFPFQY